MAPLLFVPTKTLAPPPPPAPVPRAQTALRRGILPQPFPHQASAAESRPPPPHRRPGSRPGDAVRPLPPRLNFRFTRAVLRGNKWEVPFPPFGKGWFDTVYLDDDIRVAKDIRGDYLVVERAPYSWNG